MEIRKGGTCSSSHGSGLCRFFQGLRCYDPDAHPLWRHRSQGLSVAERPQWGHHFLRSACLLPPQL